MNKNEFYFINVTSFSISRLYVTSFYKKYKRQLSVLYFIFKTILLKQTYIRYVKNKNKKSKTLKFSTKIIFYRYIQSNKRENAFNTQVKIKRCAKD